MEQVEINGINLRLAHPEEHSPDWIGMDEYLDDILACWTLLHKDDIAMSPRLLGKPGVGKTSLALAAARKYNKPAFIYQCTMDTRPEDLIITPFLSQDSKLSYFASPIVTAMLKGGVAILDEANRMNEKSWASLASLLDYRRSVESVVTGLKIEAHPDFRCCVTMNDDASTYEIPDYIISRLQPQIMIEFPSEEEERQILSYHVNFAPDKLINVCVDYLRQAHQLELDFSTRDGIHLLRYTLRLIKQNESTPQDKLFIESIRKILGEDAIDLKKLAEKRNLNVPKDLFEYTDTNENIDNFYNGFQNLSEFLRNAEDMEDDLDNMDDLDDLDDLDDMDDLDDEKH